MAILMQVLVNPVTCEFRWGGMTAQEDVQVWLEDGHRWRPRTHFGSGVVTSCTPPVIL